MLEYSVDPRQCTGCGLCVNDCPARIIALVEGKAAIAADRQDACLACQHCLAICPTGAFSILGRRPADSIPLSPPALPSPTAMETLIKGRRSVRAFRDEDLPRELIDRMLAVAWHAPTGGNRQQVHFCVIDHREVMGRMRREVMDTMVALLDAGRIPERLGYFGQMVSLWKKGIDVIFRNAPHLLIATSPRDGLCPVEDPLIALTTFEFFAATLGVGTLWCGLGRIAFSLVQPELLARLGIPEDHQFGYVMLFGKPAVRYARTVQRDDAHIHRVDVWRA